MVDFSKHLKKERMMADQKSTEELATQQPAGALTRPSFIKEDATGTEDIGRDDLRLPRLLIAQGLSEQMTPDSSSYIPDLKMFDLFNDLTNEIYGRGPIKFVPVRRDVRRIEFDPENRGTPLDLDVPLGDKRLDWTKDDSGRGVPPRATKFIEFVILMLRDGMPPEPIVLSIKETNKFQKKAAERLTGFIKMRNPPAPIFAGQYTVQSKSEKNDNGTFGVYVLNNAGYIQDEQLYRYAEKFHHSLKGKTITVAREAGQDDDSFDPATIEGQSAGGDM